MDLLEDVRAGDEEAFNQLFYRYRPVVYAVKNRYYLRDFEFEDWMQEGRICLYTSAMTFDEDQGVTFGAYFKSIFENQIKDELRKQNAMKRQSLSGAVSLDHFLLYEGRELLDPNIKISPWVEDQLVVEEVLEEFPQALSSLELDAFTAYLEGSDLEEVANDHGVTSQRVRFAFQRSRRKLLRELSLG